MKLPLTYNAEFNVGTISQFPPRTCMACISKSARPSRNKKSIQNTYKPKFCSLLCIKKKIGFYLTEEHRDREQGSEGAEKKSGQRPQTVS